MIRRPWPRPSGYKLVKLLRTYKERKFKEKFPFQKHLEYSKKGECERIRVLTIKRGPLFCLPLYCKGAPYF